MKKFVTVAVLFVLLIISTFTAVNAATSQTLPDELYAIGSRYGMREVDRVKMEQYLRDNPLSDTDCNEILSLAKQAEQIMIENNTTDVHILPADVKAQLKSLAVRAADIAGVTLDFKIDRIDVYKDGVMINVLSSSDKLAYTGNTVTPIIIASAVAMIAIATIILIRKK